MAGKARVHELAKELRVTSKQVLAYLTDQGEFVKSASSTVEARAARSVRQNLHEWIGQQGLAKPRPKPSGVAAMTSTQRRRRKLSAREVEAICRQFREAARSGNQSNESLRALFGECAATYGVPQQTVRELIGRDRKRNPKAYVRPYRPVVEHPRTSRTAEYVADDSTSSPQDYSAPLVVTRPRTQSEEMPRINGVAEPARVADLVLDLGSDLPDHRDVSDVIEHFAPDDSGVYGYLAWRFSTAPERSKLPAGSTSTVLNDLGTIARIVYSAKQMTISNGPSLDEPRRARQLLEGHFSDVTEPEGVGSSADDELRRVRKQDEFLRRSVVLLIASPDLAPRLWTMLDELRLRSPECRAEPTIQLSSATERLFDLTAAVEALLLAQEPALGRFLDDSRSELNDLRAGHYDWLLQFLNVTSVNARTSQLSFEVLPQGERLDTLIGAINATRRFNGYEADDRRVTVLKDVEAHFGAEHCSWYQGAASSDGINNEYIVLAIKSGADTEEHAVAISPLTGKHATYVVRHQPSSVGWQSILAQPKPEARADGARAFRFTDGDEVDQYAHMLDRVIRFIERS